MRTSGSGGRDGLMTAVPLGMLVLFAVWMAGGPKESVRWLESVLGSMFAWVRELVR
jgi:hypothetical protein